MARRCPFRTGCGCSSIAPDDPAQAPGKRATTGPEKTAYRSRAWSWYEASAYARFVGQELPTAHHWQHALANSMFPWLLPLSNFGGAESRPVAASRAMTERWGVRHGRQRAGMDGDGDRRRTRSSLAAAGTTRITSPAAPTTSAAPSDRSAGNGIRLAVTADEPSVAASVRAPLESRSTVAPAREPQPVSDEVYAAYGRVFDYDQGSVERSRGSHRHDALVDARAHPVRCRLRRGAHAAQPLLA